MDPADPDVTTEPDLDAIAGDLAEVEAALGRLEDGSYEHEPADAAPDPS